jgi:hypothetical protein
MHDPSGKKLAFQAQAADCPLVGGDESNHSWYCLRVTSVLSMLYPGGTVTMGDTQKPLPQASAPQKCPHVPQFWDVVRSVSQPLFNLSLSQSP